MGLKGFIQFIREQGVIGLAVGFILGGSISKVVSALVNDVLQPLLSILLGSTEGIAGAEWVVGNAHVKYGSFIVALIDFILIAAVIYYLVKGMKLDKLDAKKA